MRNAVVVGFDYHVGVLCDKMNAHAKGWRFTASPSTKTGLVQASLRTRSADALISFAGPAPRAILRAVARACRVPIFVIWAGTDVQRLLEFPEAIPQSLRADITHLAVAPWLVDELRYAGINARYVPIIGMRPGIGSEISAADGFEVLSCLREPREDFYGRPHVYEVARRLPEVKFSIVGSGMSDPLAPPNVSHFGWLPDITPLIDRCTMLLRVPDHDGMSLVVLEALARGRFAAWKYAIPGVHQVETPADTINYILELRHRLATNKPRYNEEGVAFISSTYEESKVATDLEGVIDESVSTSREADRRSHHVVISGLDMFATDVAALNKKAHVTWDAEVLQFGTKFETLGSLYNLAKSDVLYTIGAPALSRSLETTAALFKKPRIVHWVGTDIDVARYNPKILKRLRHARVTHLTEVEWEVDELRTLGINATIAPLPPRFLPADPTPPPLPRDFTVLVYLPPSRTAFYGSSELGWIVRTFTGKPVRFLVVGGGDINLPNNAQVENVGWRYSLPDIYSRSSVLVRFTPRDGLSLMVLEALAFGRHVLWTKEFPFVKHVISVQDIVKGLQELLEANEAGALCAQTAAAQYIRTTYSPDRCARRIRSAWDAAFVRNRNGHNAG